MGILLSKEKSDPNDYEKILSELDANIQKAEVRLSEIKIRERRTGVLWILYSSITWAVFLLYSFVTLHGESDVAWETASVTILPVIIIPFGIYYTRRLLKWFYARKQSNEEANLKSLRAQQKLKVEELKKKTSYYTTKSILERYDPAAAEKAKKEAAQQQQQQHARTTARAAPDQQARMRLPQTNGAAAQQPHGAGSKHPSNFQGQRGQLNGAQLRYPQQQQQQQPMFPPAPSVPRWYDKLVDALVGEEGPETKYALICRHCFAHNGLVLPQEIETIQYTCPSCKKFNPPRKVPLTDLHQEQVTSMEKQPVVDRAHSPVSDTKSEQSASAEANKIADSLPEPEPEPYKLSEETVSSS
ncbi:hypothetical protein VTP01DRAFT_8178 [Rhizomucor pusillus]|uniref:uncharacterized protein n=1 Tax=Rhizomucor pusillus TaxID=4840 RepID=UPI0037435CE6